MIILTVNTSIYDCHGGDINFGDTHISVHNVYNRDVIHIASWNSKSVICMLNHKYNRYMSQRFCHALLVRYLPLPHMETCVFGAFLGIWTPFPLVQYKKTPWKLYVQDILYIILHIYANHWYLTHGINCSHRRHSKFPFHPILVLWL